MDPPRPVGMKKEDIVAFLEELQRVYKEYFRTREHKTREDLIILNNLAKSINELRRALREINGSS